MPRKGNYGGGTQLEKPVVTAPHYLVGFVREFRCVTSKHKASLNNAARLISTEPGGAKDEARRGVSSMND